MKEKIIKLLTSGNFADVYIGLKLLDNQKKGAIPRIIRETFSYLNTENATWLLSIRTENIPRELNTQYILGKNYAYVIEEDQIMIDNKWVFNSVTKSPKELYDYYTVKEDWRNM